MNNRFIISLVKYLPKQPGPKNISPSKLFLKVDVTTFSFFVFLKYAIFFEDPKLGIKCKSSAQTSQGWRFECFDTEYQKIIVQFSFLTYFQKFTHLLSKASVTCSNLSRIPSSSSCFIEPSALSWSSEVEASVFGHRKRQLVSSRVLLPSA
jgi:hypothetical protein